MKRRQQADEQHQAAKKAGLNPTDDAWDLPEPPSPSADPHFAVHLRELKDVDLPPHTSVQQLMKDSAKFPRPFPVNTGRCETLLKMDDVSEDIIDGNINSAYPLLHESALYLFMKFLEFKKERGSDIEKSVYSGMGVPGLVKRLLQLRAVTFWKKNDAYLLVDGSKGSGGWENVGTEKERKPLILKDCLSYDEMKLSALLSVSSHTIFVNDGSRRNMAKPAPADSIQRRGVIVGLIGTRLCRPGFMEWQEVVVSATQNTVANGYGPAPDEKASTTLRDANQWRHLWAEYYGIKPHLPLFDEVAQDSGEPRNAADYLTLKKAAGIFNVVAYKKRLSVSIETLLLETQHRAKERNTTAYIHVVGIGLGVWCVTKQQENLFVQTFATCLRRLGGAVLTHVSDVHFAWFRETSCGGATHGEKLALPGGGSVRVLISKRPPQEKLKGVDSDKLLIVSYAWDGNALPGNEFWLKRLGSSGDSAAASSSQIAELHNPHVNVQHVSAEKLHVASRRWGVLHVSEYARRALNKAV